jgi:hypothetical protein
MQAVEPNTNRHLDTADHRWLDIVEGNFQARDFGGCNHVANLRASQPGPKLRTASHPHSLMDAATLSERG